MSKLKQRRDLWEWDRRQKDSLLRSRPSTLHDYGAGGDYTDGTGYGEGGAGSADRHRMNTFMRNSCDIDFAGR